MDAKMLRAKTRERAPKITGRAWYEIKNQDGDTATVRIYDEIGYWGTTADQFASDLDAITAAEIEVQINSPGGEVFDGIAIYNVLRAHPAKITTRVDGIAASAASIIVQAGDHRVMLAAGQLMIHEAWGLCVGPADDMRAYADILEQQNGVLAGIYAARSGRPVDEMRALMTAETWLTDHGAVDAGLADEVIEPAGADTTTTNATGTTTVFAELREWKLSGDAVLEALDDDTLRALAARITEISGRDGPDAGNTPAPEDLTVRALEGLRELFPTAAKEGTHQ